MARLNVSLCCRVFPSVGLLSVHTSGHPSDNGTGTTTTMRRMALRETGVWRYHRGIFKAPLKHTEHHKNGEFKSGP